jgi:hypothetical protein
MYFLLSIEHELSSRANKFLIWIWLHTSRKSIHNNQVRNSTFWAKVLQPHRIWTDFVLSTNATRLPKRQMVFQTISNNAHEIKTNSESLMTFYWTWMFKKKSWIKTQLESLICLFFALIKIKILDSCFKMFLFFFIFLIII